jgi:acyl-CoA reductase-like NAD-dependent aldehyde dehydrogenase
MTVTLDRNVGDADDEVVDGVSEIAKSIKLGSGMEPGSQMGPLVSAEQLSRVTGYLESGKADGATALTGGGRSGRAPAHARHPAGVRPRAGRDLHRIDTVQSLALRWRCSGI